jgi:hypothetical protein
MQKYWIAIVLGTTVTHAQADPDEAELEAAPPPGAESGRVDNGSDADSVARVAARGALYIPRTVVDAVLLPIRGGIWVDDRYHVSDRIHDWFFTEGGRFGIYPLAFFDTSQGVMFGAQGVAAFTPDQKATLFAGAGTLSRRRVDGQFRTRNHFGGRVGLELGGEYDVLPQNRFYGIGNGDEIDEPVMQLDPFDDEVAAKSFYKDTLTRATAIMDVRLAARFYLDVAGSVADRERGTSSDGPMLEDVFTPVPMFDDYRAGYAELGLRYDSRHARSQWQPQGLSSTGSLLLAYGGRAMLDPGSSFWRYGLDAQHYVTIGSGPRVIALRLQAEAITGEREEVPFTELPSLGGRAKLRGYPLDRFRDRVAAVGTLEYQWDLSRALYTSLFVDVGRVYPALDDLSLDDLRCGYGISLEAHSRNSMVARVSMASSIDGGLFFNLYLDPVSEVEPRVRRR